MTDLVLALDVGGTKTHAALVDRDFRLIDQVLRSTRGRDPGLRSTLAAATALADRAGREGGVIRGVAAGVAEYVSPTGLLTSREVLDWTAQPEALLTAAAPSVPVVIDSDVRCGAIGEARHGRGVDFDDFVYVSLGTGLSATLVERGIPRAGHRGEAIALGEFEVSARVDPTWPGTLETFASGTGVAMRYLRSAGDMAAVNAGSGVVGARDVVDRARAGDVLADATLRSAGRALAAALAQVVAMLDPAAVVLGGGLGTAVTPLTEALHDEYVRLTAARPGGPPLLASSAPANAGVLGAATLAWRQVARPCSTEGGTT